MSYLVKDIIKDSMSLVGAIAMDEQPTPSEMNLGLRSLNLMLDGWSASRLMLRSTVLESFPLTPGKASYTIGPGGEMSTAKPTTILSAYARDSQGSDFTVEVIPAGTFDSLGDKSFVGGAQPEYLYYSPGASQQTSPNHGTLSFYPIPGSGYTIFIRSDKYLSEFSSITSVVNFEPAYYEALVYNLALRLFRHFHKADASIPEDIVLIAKSAMDRVKLMNHSPVRASTDIFRSRGRYDIYSDRN